MYLQHWQLQGAPFENGARAEFYYPSEIHQGALLKLRYTVENRRGGAALAGASGLGNQFWSTRYCEAFPSKSIQRCTLSFQRCQPIS